MQEVNQGANESLQHSENLRENVITVVSMGISWQIVKRRQLSKERNSAGSMMKKKNSCIKCRCFFCKQIGHRATDCDIQKRNDKRKEAANVTVQGMKKNSVLMAIGAVSKKLMEDTWVADSGATCHVTNKLKGLYNVESIKEPITIGDGSKVYATMCGDLDV